MGSSGTDYSKQINTALSQANLPKSPLAQQYSSMFAGVAPSIMQSLLNVQSLGNSFLNSNGSTSPTYTPPKVTVSPYQNPIIGTQAQPGQFAGPTLGPNGPNPNFNSTPNNTYKLPGGTPTATQNNVGIPSIPGYNGGFTPAYSNIGGVDVSQYLGQGLRIGDLVNKGILTQDQVNSYFGNPQGFNPSTDLQAQQQYNNYIASMKANPNANQNQLPDFNTWYNTVGQGGTNLDSYNPNDLDAFYSAVSALPQTQFNGSTLFDQSGNGQYSISGFNPNNTTGPEQPTPINFNATYGGTGGFNPGYGGPETNPTPINYQLPPYGSTPGTGPGSVVSNTANGLPNGVTAPGAAQTYNGNLVGALQSLQQALGMSSGQVGSIGNYSSPGALQTVGNTGGASLNQVDLTSPILATLQRLQQGPGSAAQADLSKIPTGTQLSPQTSQGFNAISDILNQQLNKNLADTRERAISTGNARSTGESYDEATLKAQALPQLASALSNLYQTSVGNQLQSAGLQQSGALGNAQLANEFNLGAQSGNNSALGTVLGTNTAQNQNQLSNFYNAISALQSQLGLGNTATNNTGQLALGQGTLLGGIGQGNTQQANQYNLATTGMAQQAQQSAIANQLQALMTLFGGGLGMASQGIPGGSANVNIGNNPISGNGIGGTLAGLGSLLQGISYL